MAANRDEPIILKEGENTYGSIDEQTAMTGNGDFDSPGLDTAVAAPSELPEDQMRIEIESLTEADLRAAQVQLARETGEPTEDLVSKVAEANYRKQQYDGNGGLTPEHSLESSMRAMNSRLKEKLSSKITLEKGRLEDAQKKGIWRILATLRLYSPAHVSDEYALERVLDAEVVRGEEIMERRKVRSNQRLKEYELKSDQLRKVRAERRGNYELYENSEAHLKTLEEQITENKKAVIQYEDERRKPDYNGSVDTLLESSRETVDNLSAQRSKVKRCQEKLLDNLTDYTDEVKSQEDASATSEFNYLVAKEKYTTAKAKVRKLLEMRDNRHERESLLVGYKEMINEDKDLEDVGVIVEETEELLETIGRVQTEMLKTEKAYTRTKIRSLTEDYLKENERNKQQVLAECRKDIFNI